MSKKSRQQKPSTSSADAADIALINKVFSSLRIPGSKDTERWTQRVIAELPEEVWRRWEDLRNSGQPDEFYELSHRDLRTSMLLSAGLQSDISRQELAWLLPRLRRDLAGKASPVVVEIGSGSGVAAAVVSLALGVRVIAIDKIAEAASIAAQVALATGADIEPHAAMAVDLPGLLGGRRADAVYTLRTMRHLQGHEHAHAGDDHGPGLDTRGASFSFVRQFERSLRTTEPSADLRAVMGCLGDDGALYWSDPSCPDRLVELEGALAKGGWHLAPADRRVVEGIAVGYRESIGLASARRAAAGPTALDFLQYLVGPFHRPTGLGWETESFLAEYLRLTTERQTLQAVEMHHPSGVVERAELSRGEKDLSVYRAASNGTRYMSFKDISELPDTLHDWAIPVDPSTGIREAPLGGTALDW